MKHLRPAFTRYIVLPLTVAAALLLDVWIDDTRTYERLYHVLLALLLVLHARNVWHATDGEDD